MLMKVTVNMHTLADVVTKKGLLSHECEEEIVVAIRDKFDQFFLG